MHAILLTLLRLYGLNIARKRIVIEQINAGIVFRPDEIALYRRESRTRCHNDQAAALALGCPSGAIFMRILLVSLMLSILPACSTIPVESRIGTAIVGARIYPTPTDPPIDNGVILIRRGTIERVGPSESISIPKDFKVLDQAGMFITAGFVNSHVHLTTPVFFGAADHSDADLNRELERTFTRWGYTTIFDLASTTQISTEIANRLESGRIKGPRILSVAEPFYPRGATPIYARPFYKAFALPSAEISTDREAEDRARRQIVKGADGVKLFTGSIVGENEIVHMDPVSAAAIAQIARSCGKPVFAHPTDQRGIEIAVESGATALAHAAPLMGTWSEAFAEWIVAHQAALIPTLSLFEFQPHSSTPVDVAVDQVRRFHRSGGVVLFGTDAGFAEIFDPSAELDLLEDAIGWQGVLAALTTSPAAFLGEASKRGRIEVGYAADLVILHADPAADARNLARVRVVFRDGEVVYEDKPGH